MNMVHVEEIGEEYFDEMQRLLIRGVVIQIMGDDCIND